VVFGCFGLIYGGGGGGGGGGWEGFGWPLVIRVLLAVNKKKKKE
jgi:hypothetical protein